MNLSQNNPSGTGEMELPNDILNIMGMSTEPKFEHCLILMHYYGAVGQGGMPGMQVRVNLEFDLSKESKLPQPEKSFNKYSTSSYSYYVRLVIYLFKLSIVT